MSEKADSLRKWSQENPQIYQIEFLPLHNANLTQLPSEICSFANLTELHFYNNQLRILPESIGRIAHLAGLWIAEPQLQMLPDSIGELIGLHELSLDSNLLKILPDSICKLTKLTRFWFKNYQMQEPSSETLAFINKFRRATLHP